MKIGIVVFFFGLYDDLVGEFDDVVIVIKIHRDIFLIGIFFIRHVHHHEEKRGALCTSGMIFKLLLSLEKLSYGTHGVKEFEAISGPTVSR